jgi:hypothetical protein
MPRTLIDDPVIDYRVPLDLSMQNISFSLQSRRSENDGSSNLSSISHAYLHSI